MGYTPEQHEIEQAEAERIALFEKDVVIAGDSNVAWAVISLGGGHRFHDPCPCVIYSGLKTREAAEIARWDALEGLTDQTHGSPYGPSEVPLGYFNAAGRVLKLLRDDGIEHDNLIQLTTRIALVASADTRPERCDGDEDGIPF